MEMAIKSSQQSGVRKLYTHDQMHRLIDPASVAIIGVSETKGSFGQRTHANMARYTGRLFQINPKYTELRGTVCYPDLHALPEVPDCVVVAVPREYVAGIVETCGQLGVGGVVIYASGFAETGKQEKVAAQAEIARLAAAYGVRVVGPNCVGLVNVISGAGMHFMPEFDEMPLLPGKVAIVSQSGALGYTLLQGMKRGVGFSHYLAAGNSCDVDACDYINYLADDPETTSIACILEGVRDGARFIEAGRRVFEANKTLVVYKTGRGEESRAVALSHTGSMIGTAQAYDAALLRMGAVSVDDLSQLLETAAFFSKVGTPTAGNGIGVMATSGGAAVACIDMAQVHGVTLPRLSDKTAEVLHTVVPDFGRVGNPADTTAEVLRSSETFGVCVDAFLSDQNFSALVAPIVFASRMSSEARAEFLCRFAADRDKPIVLIWMNDWLEGPGAATIESNKKLTLFRSANNCFRTLRYWFDLAQRRASPAGIWPDIEARASGISRAAVSRATGTVLTERESKQVFQAYGIAVTVEHLALDADAAVRLALDIGYPVALKVESSDIAHKTEAGVVRLGLNGEAAVRGAYREVLEAAKLNAPAARVNGVLVQKMISSGIEMVVGVHRDMQFGPMIMVGFGGVLVEVLRDTAVRLAPVSRDEAREMLTSLRGARLFGGFRGQAAIDIDALADCVSRASMLASQLCDDIEQIDINPVIASSDGAVAVDGLIVLSSRTTLQDAVV